MIVTTWEAMWACRAGGLFYDLFIISKVSDILGREGGGCGVGSRLWRLGVKKINKKIKLLMSAKRTAPLRWRQFLAAITPTRGLSQFFFFFFSRLNGRRVGKPTCRRIKSTENISVNVGVRRARRQFVRRSHGGGSRDTPPSVSAVGRPLFTQMTDGGVGVGQGGLWWVYIQGGGRGGG